AGRALEDRNAHVFGDAGKYRRLVDNDVAALQRGADRARCRAQGLEVWRLAVVDWRGNGDDVEVRLAKVFALRREAQSGRRQRLGVHFSGPVAALHEFIDAARV